LIEASHTWYGAMRIPLSAIDARSPVAGKYDAHQPVSEPGTALASASRYLAGPYEGFVFMFLSVLV